MPYYILALAQTAAAGDGSAAGEAIAKLIYDASDVVYYFGANLAVTTLLIIALQIIIQSWRQDSSYGTALTLNIFLPYAAVVFYMTTAPDIANFIITQTLGISPTANTGYAWLDRLINVFLAFLLPILKSLFSLGFTIQGVKGLLYIVGTWGTGDYAGVLFSMLKHFIYYGVVGMIFGGIGDVIRMILQYIST